MILSLGESSLAIDWGLLPEAIGHSAWLSIDCGSHNTTQRMIITEYINFVFYYCPSSGTCSKISKSPPDGKLGGSPPIAGGSHLFTK